MAYAVARDRGSCKKGPYMCVCVMFVNTSYSTLCDQRFDREVQEIERIKKGNIRALLKTSLPSCIQLVVCGQCCLEDFTKSLSVIIVEVISLIPPSMKYTLKRSAFSQVRKVCKKEKNKKKTG